MALLCFLFYLLCYALIPPILLKKPYSLIMLHSVKNVTTIILQHNRLQAYSPQDSYPLKKIVQAEVEKPLRQ